ncbi:hypothetical protein [Parasitella parasitica]|uniref:Uncharacterized protein n=1 Tax=Parasitella parasitica TaxID=35722 RepID=A0A0B7NLX5_9FUNG|nr:hypothetical protein [Parasitella parasitica]
MTRKKKPSSDQSGDSSSEHDDASSRKKRDNLVSQTTSTYFGAPPSVPSDMNIGKGTSHKPKKNLPKKDKGKGKASSSSPIPAAQQEAVTAQKKNKGKEKASILPPAAHNFQQVAPGPSTAPSNSTAVSTPADYFDAILSAMSPE